MSARLDIEVRYSIVPEWVLDHEQGGLSANAVRLYAVLARYGNSEGASAFPSRSTLAKRMGVSKLETVDRAARELKEAGAVEVESRPGQSSLYVLAVARPTPINGVSPSTGYPAESGRGVPRSTGHDREKKTEKTSTDVEVAEPPKKTRPPDPVWDVLVELFGPVVEKTNAHGKRNKAVKDLKALGATAETVKTAYRAWPRSFEGATVTDVALATHYPQLAQQSGIKPGVDRIPPCRECEMGGGLHAADCSHASPIEKLAGQAA